MACNCRQAVLFCTRQSGLLHLVAPFSTTCYHQGTNPLLCYINPHAISTERGHKGPPPYSVDTGTCACSPWLSKALPAGGEVPAPSHRVMLSTISARHLRLELPSNLSAWTRPRVTRSFALPTYGEVSHRAILSTISAHHLRFIYRPIEAAATFFATPANINKRRPGDSALHNE